MLNDRFGDEATHRVVTRRASGVKDWDESGELTVENRVFDVLVRFGDAIHFRIADDTERLERYKERLERVDGADTVLAGTDAEYRAMLPRDGDVVRSMLEVESDDTDGWIDRRFNLDEFAVVTGDDWLYRSVPHHAHIRDLNAAGRGELLEAIRAELESVPRSAVVPADGFVSWRSGSSQYELTWDALRRSETGTGDGWTTFELDRLRHVAFRPDRDPLALEFDWEPASADSPLRRVTRRVLEPESVDPPARLAFPDRNTLDETVESLRELRTELAYRFGIDAPRGPG